MCGSFLPVRASIEALRRARNGISGLPRFAGRTNVVATGQDCPRAPRGMLPGGPTIPLRPRRAAPHWLLLPVLGALASVPAHAIMDIKNRGPLLEAGRFALRVTNVGVLGNAFFNNGLSFDPSFEFPRGSGHELLNHAELWVGARDEFDRTRVSGGPMLEWRPTLDPADTVRIANAGDPGSRPYFDDDRDGRTDEDPLNGRDDDGDGRIDEDFRLPAQQMLAADYTDDQQTAVDYAYPTGERHLPLGLAVHQETYAWSLPGHENIAGIEFTITNRGDRTLSDVRLGLYADLDSRARAGGAGHLDDRLDVLPYSVLLSPHADTLFQGIAIPGPPLWIKQCGELIAGQGAVLRDASAGSTAPGIVLVPLTHTFDPLGRLSNDAFPGVRAARLAAQERAPYKDTTFRFVVFQADAPPGQGGPPVVDVDRYAALAGDYPAATRTGADDYAVLVSCGPFGRLAPGQSLRFALALVALPAPDSAAAMAFEARLLYRGQRLDLRPNGRHGPVQGGYRIGETGVNGHELCIEPPAGTVFDYDPHCPEKFGFDPLLVNVGGSNNPGTTAAESTYHAGKCIWTDLDCDICTGDDGVDEVRPWLLDVRLPPQPSARSTPQDHAVVLEWDNEPERAIRSGRVGTSEFEFAGYKVYRLDDWRRESTLPEPERWQRLAVFRPDPALGGRPLADVTVNSVLPDADGPGGPHYPVGRYRFVDERALDGFDYHYVVTALLREVLGPSATRAPLEYESPFFASFDDRVVPHAAARAAAGQVWVVPNPYRGSADWERPQVPGDVFTRHVDFMGLPRARCTVRIYTLAGDLVASVEHDGSRGDGQASWNLISRNGQDVESGVYLFTVNSPLGHQTGRFVVIR